MQYTSLLYYPITPCSRLGTRHRVYFSFDIYHWMVAYTYRQSFIATVFSFPFYDMISKITVTIIPCSSLLVRCRSRLFQTAPYGVLCHCIIYFHLFRITKNMFLHNPADKIQFNFATRNNFSIFVQTFNTMLSALRSKRPFLLAQVDLDRSRQSNCPAPLHLGPPPMQFICNIYANS